VMALSCAFLFGGPGYISIPGSQLWTFRRFGFD
jgi:hypothetical protein